VATTVVLGKAINSFQLRLKAFSTSPVTVNFHPAVGGFVSGSKAALFAAGIALQARLVKISNMVIIVAIPAKNFFNLMPTVLAYKYKYDVRHI